MAMQPWNDLSDLTTRERQRREDLMDWWMSQLQSQLKRYMAQPTGDRKAALLTLMADYAKHVEDGTVKPPRFSTD